jgi:3-oxoacyl-[acyl-carrier protein] reductase
MGAGKGVAVVTGAAGALGRAVALRYRGRGRAVLAIDREPAGLEALLAAGAETAAADLADPAAIEAALARLAAGAPIGVLVNAVGLIWNEPVLALKGAKFTAHAVANFERVIAANLTAAFAAAASVAARMARSGGGVIVNFSSISAAGNAGQAAYSAAKAGVEGMTRAMAQELGPLGVRVNALAPGFIDVETTRAALAPDRLEELRRRTPVGRLGGIDDLMNALDAIEANAFLNGAVVPLDGGLRL